MFGASVASQNFNTFDFSMRTSSGDKIDLSMYSNQESEMAMVKDKGISAMRLSIKEEYGYSFSYEGNGIDAQDRKEIAKALEQIEPLLTMFQNNSFAPSHESATNLAFDINANLPKAKDDNHKNFMKDSILDKFDEMLDLFDAVDEMREFAKDVFDMLEAQMEGLTVYA
ncbi:MAG: ATP/GTP-binding protein [Epsilonproteobacteria bacterium]|nr:ATP/GTP-binding protein [Campylobacterota bacterium]